MHWDELQNSVCFVRRMSEVGDVMNSVLDIVVKDGLC